MTVEPSLQRNIDAYVEQLDTLLEQHGGKFVLFADAKLFRIVDTYEAALTLGYKEFGRSPFLLQRIEPIRETA